MGEIQSSFWPKVLADICKLQGGYAFKSSEFSNVGIPVVKIADVTGGGQIDYASMQRVPKDVAAKAERFATAPRDTLISMTGANVGKVSRVGNEVVDARINQRVGRFIPKADLGYSKDYIHYIVSADTAYAYFATAAYGSAQPNISASLIESLPIPAFSSDYANLIGSILSSLDDKIELNRQMNQTLEAMARAVFLDWFVDFGPTRRKMAGETDPAAILGGLIPNPTQSAPLAALFPDSFGANGLPMGWANTRIGDVADIVKGRSYKSSELQSSTTALVTLKSFARQGGYRPEGLKPYVGEFKQNQVVTEGEVVVALTDVTQAAELIGRPARVAADGRFHTLVASLDVAIVRPKPNMVVTREFLFGTMATDEFTAHTFAHTSGTTVLHLSKDAIPNYDFPLPHSHLIAAYDELASPLRLQQNINQIELVTLAATRDLLLPKLMSGELRLKGEMG